jgi:tetratricopeptide (TPR) repeat protein
MQYSTIVGNWAVALQHIGNLGASRQRLLESHLALTEAGAPTLYVTSNELEILRIDVKEGNVDQALPEIEKGVAKMEKWWLRSRSGETLSDVPNPAHLAHMLLSALDLDRQARIAVEDWGFALRRTDAILELRTALKNPIETIAGERRNRGVLLTQLHRYGEAKAELEDCLQFFDNDPLNRASAFAGLADLMSEQGDVSQAIVQARRAHAILSTLPDPETRSGSHNNLANYLRESGDALAVLEALRHRIAALTYALVSGLNLQAHIYNYVRYYKCDRQTDGSVPAIPVLREVLADPAFRSLDEWLRQRNRDVASVQVAIDKFLSISSYR